MDCPLCGAKMIIRTAKSGKNKGRNFWGCSNYPNCHGLVDFPESMQLKNVVIGSNNCAEFTHPKTVKVGSKVKIKFIKSEEIAEYYIFRLNREEIVHTGYQYSQFQKPYIVVTNPGDPTITLSDESPLGRALVGKSEGDIISYKSIDGSFDVKVLGIS